jgi:quercetin dioxygenase-like cupin family protein
MTVNAHGSDGKVAGLFACIISRGTTDARTQEAWMLNSFEQDRRSFLFSLGAIGISQVLPQRMSGAEDAARQGYVLGSAEGEHLVHFRDRGKILIKVGSGNLALGTQQIMAGTGIPTHRHLQMEEAFYVLDGGGIFILNDVRHSFEKGGTIFIPRNSWHGFENPDHELLLLWIMSPAGLDGFFRETCTPPGVPPKQLTRAQIKEIALKYGIEFK